MHMSLVLAHIFSAIAIDNMYVLTAKTIYVAPIVYDWTNRALNINKAG